MLCHAVFVIANSLVVIFVVPFCHHVTYVAKIPVVDVIVVAPAAILLVVWLVLVRRYVD